MSDKKEAIIYDVRPAAVTPQDLLAIAVEKDADIDKLEKLMDLQERWERNEAKKAWVTAMAEFKREPLDVKKSSQVKFKNKDGTWTEYWHANLAATLKVISARLSEFGLSVRWDTKQEGNITVSCHVTHILGHTESTTLTASPDNSGGKNSIQAIGSAVTYLQRYTLMAACGLASEDMQQDNDGICDPDATAKYILDKIEADDELAVGEAWVECSQREMEVLWKAKTKGGYFTQANKTYIRAAAKAFKQANGGESADGA